MNAQTFSRIGVGVLGLLLVPLLGSIFTDAFNWGVADYVIMGALLFAVGSGITWSWKTIQRPVHRWIVMGGSLFLGLLIWAELAVDAVSKAIGFN